MTQGVQNLISAIDSGDATAIDAAFNAEMATRISSKLEDMRVSVAQNMFEVEQPEETQEDNSEVELSTEDETVLSQEVEAEVEGA